MTKAIDLLRFRAVRTVVHGRWFPYALQATALGVFLAFMVLGWQRFAPEGVPDKLYAKTNLVTLVVWGIWWPLMVWAAVLLGRAWCMVCPLELVANVTERVGRRLGIRQRKLGRWLRSGALIVLLYATVQMLVAGIHLHRVPAYTVWMLFALVFSAAVVGALFKDRAFCRGVCPVGLLLATYGRGGTLAVRHRSAEVCSACNERSCVRACNRTRWDGRACPSLLNPARLDSNRDCLLCGQCIKSCKPDNMTVLLRRPFPVEDAREKLAPWSVVAFVVMVSGFVTYELCTEWPAAKSVFLWVPGQVTAALALSPNNGWIKGVWTLFVFPASVWLVLGLIVRASGGAETLAASWRRLALPAVVVVAAGHMAKGVAKLASWGGFVPMALADPDGSDHATRIAAGTLEPPGHVFGMSLVAGSSLVLIAVATIYGLREATIANPRAAKRLAPAILAIGLAFAILVLGWGS